MKKLTLISFLFACVASFAVVNFPYPQAHPYGNNTIIATNWNCAGQTASSMLLNHFKTYLTKYYEESGNMARIKFDESQYTVSEGIGYGMILCVYFSNSQTSYQSQFDKLWNYYQRFVNGNGLMNWKINGFSSVIGSNGATDADEDVAFALAMAYYQFGDEKYKNAASSLISKIRQKEFTSSGMHKPGDGWDNPKNPSYISPAAYEIFKIFDSGSANFWSSAINTNYTLLKNNAHATTGIPSGWSNESGYAQVGNNGYNFAGYDYDAVRAPWRWAWSYAWYGHSQAQSLISKLAAWVASKNANQLYINMNQNGTINEGGEPCRTNGCKANGSSIGSLSCPLIVNSTYQEKLNANFGALMSQQEGYYHSNLRLLTGLLMSGNMQNFANNYKNQPFTFTMTEEQKASCEQEVKTCSNSGNYDWISNSTTLSNETNTGFSFSTLCNNSATNRVVERTVDGLTVGKNYKLTFNTSQSGTSDFYLQYRFYADAERQTEYKECGGSKLIPSYAQFPFECTFTATSPVFHFYLQANNWDEPTITVSDYSLVDAESNEDVLPESIGARQTSKNLNIHVDFAGDRAMVWLPKNKQSRIVLMDMQGRALSAAVIGTETLVEVPLKGLRYGRYLMAVYQDGASWVRGFSIEK